MKKYSFFYILKKTVVCPQATAFNSLLSIAVIYAAKFRGFNLTSIL